MSNLGSPRSMPWSNQSTKDSAHVGIPGAITPFYRERSVSHPQGIEPFPGINYTEYQLYFLNK